jgi:hypothetical protein
MFVILVTLVRLLLTVLFTVICMPSRMIGGELITTAGATPMGAGTINPRYDPGGAGTKTPCGPIAATPATIPAATMAGAIRMLGAGATNVTPGAAQKPLMNMTECPRCS